jgi:hypothetical protein
MGLSKRDILRARCKSPTTLHGGHLRVTGPRFAAELLRRAQERNPKARFHLVCARCHSYIPEKHERVGAWTIEHAAPLTGEVCHPQHAYRFLDPLTEAGVEVYSALSPVEQLAEVEKDWST